MSFYEIDGVAFDVRLVDIGLEFRRGKCTTGRTVSCTFSSIRAESLACWTTISCTRETGIREGAIVGCCRWAIPFAFCWTSTARDSSHISNIGEWEIDMSRHIRMEVVSVTESAGRCFLSLSWINDTDDGDALCDT